MAAKDEKASSDEETSADLRYTSSDELHNHAKSSFSDIGNYYFYNENLILLLFWTFLFDQVGPASGKG